MWLDLLTGTVIIIAILQGYKNGLIRAVVSFLSLFIGLMLAFQFAGFVAGQLKQHTKISGQFLPFISFLIVLIAVLFLLRWVSAFLQQGAQWLMLGWLNKLLGIILYTIIYCTMLSAIVYFLELLGVIEAAKIKQTYSYDYLHRWWPLILEKMSIWVPSIKQTITNFSNPFK
jgi:membrane protein required for colicin V production